MSFNVCYISSYIEDIISYVDQRVYVLYKKNDLSLQSKFKLITGRERESEPNWHLKRREERLQMY